MLQDSGTSGRVIIPDISGLELPDKAVAVELFDRKIFRHYRGSNKLLLHAGANGSKRAGVRLVTVCRIGTKLEA